MARVRICLVLLFLGLGFAAAAETVFIEGLGDVPLMPGLAVVEDGGVTFDTPAGRIVEVVAVGDVQAAEVRAFYGGALPQLGWKRRGGGFHREGERLRLETRRTGGRLAVHFRLVPAK